MTKKGDDMGTAVLPDVVKDAIAPVKGKAKKTETKKPEAVATLPASAIIEAPLGSLDQGYLPTHVEARLTTPKQRASMRRLLRGLLQAGERLDDGKLVQSNADAVRWLLEKLGAA